MLYIYSDQESLLLFYKSPKIFFYDSKAPQQDPRIIGFDLLTS